MSIKKPKLDTAAVIAFFRTQVSRAKANKVPVGAVRMTENMSKVHDIKMKVAEAVIPHY